MDIDKILIKPAENSNKILGESSENLSTILLKYRALTVSDFRTTLTIKPVGLAMSEDAYMQAAEILTCKLQKISPQRIGTQLLGISDRLKFTESVYRPGLHASCRNPYMQAAENFS